MNKVITLGKWEGRGVFVGWHIVHFVCNIFGAQCVQSGILGKKQSCVQEPKIVQASAAALDSVGREESH